ncbi:MAG: hypothetical protein ABL962_15025 [Fimbriimonadaceae bacterium]
MANDQDDVADSKSKKAMVDMEGAIADPNVAKIYANGFAVGTGNADMFILLQRFGRPMAIVNLSYTLAKTLSQKLGGMVAEFEQKVGGQPMLTTDRIDKAVASAAESNDEEVEVEKQDVH